MDGAGKRWLLRVTVDRCQKQEAVSALQGAISIASTTEEAKQRKQESWVPKDWLAQKKRVSSTQTSVLPTPFPPLNTMMLGYHPLLFRF